MSTSVWRHASVTDHTREWHRNGSQPLCGIISTLHGSAHSTIMIIIPGATGFPKSTHLFQHRSKYELVHTCLCTNKHPYITINTTHAHTSIHVSNKSGGGHLVFHDSEFRWECQHSVIWTLSIFCNINIQNLILFTLSVHYAYAMQCMHAHVQTHTHTQMTFICLCIM